MADRVAFAAETGDEVVNSGFNGLRHQIEYGKGHLVEIMPYPIGFSLSNLVKLLWRVKKFEITAGGEMSAFGERERDIINGFQGAGSIGGFEYTIFLANPAAAEDEILANDEATLFYPSFEVFSDFFPASETVTHGGQWNSSWEYSNESFSLTITPVEYWPFAAKDGSPIFNTQTGEQLQDPRN